MGIQRRIDNQAIDSRFGGALWLTDFITPHNPEVMLKFDSLVSGISSQADRIMACWRYVSKIRYRETVVARLSIGGRSRTQSDTWLYPAETISQSPVANCAVKSFLLTSLLRNELDTSQVKCVLGHVTLDGIGAHAWVTVHMEGKEYILETTITDINKALLPAGDEAYAGAIAFDDTAVYSITDEMSILNERFGFCAQPFLRDYICERCKALEDSR